MITASDQQTSVFIDFTENVDNNRLVLTSVRLRVKDTTDHALVEMPTKLHVPINFFYRKINANIVLQ